jgi:hypothetical protein
MSLEDAVIPGDEALGTVETEVADMQQALSDEEPHIGWVIRQRIW